MGLKKIAQNIKTLRHSLKLSQKEFAIKLGCKWYQIKDMETGKTKPSLELISKISENFSINYDWLLVGSGEMFKDDRNVEKSGKNKSLFYRRLEKIEIMLKDMDEEKQEAVLKYIQEKKRLGEMERQIEELQRRVDVA